MATSVTATANMASWTQQSQAKFEEWTLLTASARSQFSRLETTSTEMNHHCGESIAFATTASALVTTADEAVSTARVDVA